MQDGDFNFDVTFERQPDLKVETLIGDFQGKLDLVEEARLVRRFPSLATLSTGSTVAGHSHA